MRTYIDAASPEDICWLDDLGVGYGDRVVLNDIELDFPASGLIALMGPTGVGKSTLLRVICGSAQQSANLKLWGEMRYLGLMPGEAGWPSMIVQDARLLVSTTRENLACGLANRSELSQQQQLRKIQAHLKTLDCEYLMDTLDQQVVELALADQRIIAIVRQTLAAPALLCADEPTSGLDDADAARVIDVLKRWSDRHTTIVAIHNQRLVKEYADRVVLLASGRVQEQCPAADFFSGPKSTAGKEFLARGTCTSIRPDASPEELDESIPAPPPLPKRTKKAMSAWSGPRGFVWLEKGRLAGTPMPGVVDDLDYDLDALQRVGVTRLLTLLEQPLECESELAARGIESVHAEIADMAAPTLIKAIELCRQIDLWLGQHQIVAVHCRAGHGRTGTALAAWRIWHGQSTLEAIEQVRQLERRWIQSSEQAEFLERFDAHLRKKQTAGQ